MRHIVTLLTLFLSCPAACRAGQSGLRRLELDKPLTGTITHQTEVVATEALDRLRSEPSSVHRGETFTVSVSASGTYRIELSAYLFDAYLVLRDQDGRVIAEDDNGSLVSQSRIVASLEKDRKYAVQACALHDCTGEFQLALRAGAPAPLTGPELHSETVREAKAILRARESALDPNDPLVAIAHDTVGTCYWQLGGSRMAMPFMQRALAIWQHNYPQGHSLVADGLVKVGAQMEGLGDPVGARSNYERAITMLDSMAQPNMRHLALALNRLGMFQMRQGEMQAAEEHLARGMKLSEEHFGPEDPDTATALNSFAGLLLLEEKHREAEPLLRRALAIREVRLAPDDPLTASTLDHLGLVTLNLHRPGAALGLFERALAIRRIALQPEAPETLMTLGNLGQAQRALGRYTEAEQTLRRAARQAKATYGAISPLTLEFEANLSGVLGEQGRFDEAVEFARSVVAGREKVRATKDKGFVQALHALASVRFHQRENQLPKVAIAQDDESAVLFERAMKSCGEILGTDNPTYGSILEDYSSVCVAQKRIEMAEELLRRSLAIRKKWFGERGLTTAAAMDDLALVLQLQGRHEEAEPMLRDALAIAEETGGRAHPDVFAARTQLAQLLREMGRLDEALTEARAASSNDAMLLAELIARGDAGASLRHADRIRGGIEVFLDTCLVRNEQAVLDEAFSALANWQGRVFRAGQVPRGQLAAIADDHRNGLAELRTLQDQLSGLAGADKPAADIQTLVTRRRELEAEIVAKARAKLPALSNVAEIAASLPPRSALLDLHVREDYESGKFQDGKYRLLPEAEEALLSAWVVRAGQAHVQHVPLGRAPKSIGSARAWLRQLGAADGRGIAVREAPAADMAESAALHAQLWMPLQPLLQDVERIFVFAGGELGRLPLETLRAPDGKFLIERHDFVYLDDPLAFVTRGGAALPDSSKGLLVVCGVDYGTANKAADSAAATPPPPADPRWPSLPATAQEGSKVAEAWRVAFPAAGMLVLAKESATEERLKAALPEHSVLHLATHALIDATMNSKDLPGLPASLVCAGANATADPWTSDAMLTAEEIACLDLRRAQLVVLSACETSLARSVDGEGRMSLRHALHLAGAKEVVSSLWRVDELATAALMLDFYDRMWRQGLEPARALREAKLAMLDRYRRAGDANPRPTHWGAFVISASK